MSDTQKYPGKVAIVTGARGFLGRHMSRALNASGWSVLGLGHRSWAEDSVQQWGLARWVQGPVNLSTLKALGVRPSLICHCAGGSSVGQSIKMPRDDFRRTVETTMDVLEFARLNAPDAVVLYPSSAAVYGVTTKLPMHEGDPCQPISPYGVHKLMAEQACAYYARNFGLRIICVRLFSVYGPHLHKQLFWDACKKMAQKTPKFFGSGLETRDWINVRDAASLLLAAIQRASTDAPIVNGGTGQSVPTHKIVDAIASHFPDCAPTFRAGARAGDPDHYKADMTKAFEWGWKPEISIEQGIADYVTWFRENETCIA